MLNRVLRRVAFTVALLFGMVLAAPAYSQEWTAGPTPEEESGWDVPLPPEGWETVYGSFLRVHGDPQDYAQMLRLARHGSDALPRLATELGVPIGDTIHVYIAGSDTEFRALQPGTAPSWADATAYPSLGVIYLRSSRARHGQSKPLEQVMDHELVHILLGRAFYPKRPPQWLQEGVAQVMAGEFTPRTTEDLAAGMLGGGLLSLEELSRGFPSDARRAKLAYAQSADFVAWIQMAYGPEVLGMLIHEMAAGASIRAAIRRSTGAFLEDIDREWRGRLNSGIPLSLMPLTSVDAWWAFGGVALLVGGVLRRRQFRRRLAEMEAEERLLDEMLEQMAAERLER
jgi:hypothetical protein